MMAETMYAVRLANNTNPKARDQISDAGRTREECVKSAQLYTETSHFQTIEVLELQVVSVERVN